jgi:hypothetical protein
MADLKNRQWILAKPPVGMIKESDYRWKRRRETGESLAPTESPLYIKNDIRPEKMLPLRRTHGRKNRSSIFESSQCSDPAIVYCQHMDVVIVEGSPSSFRSNVLKEVDYNFIALRDELAKFKHLEIQNPDHSVDKLGEPFFALQITCTWPRPFRHRMVKDEVLRTETQNCRHVTTSEGIEKFLNHTHVLLLAHGNPPSAGY